MEFINYLSVLLVSYLGLGVGIALALVAKEEIASGKRFFKFLQNILPVTIVLITIYFLEFHWLPWILFLGFSVIIIFIKKERKKAFVTYLLFSVIFWISSQPHSFFPVDFLFPIIASLIFLSGFTIGSLLMDIKKRNIFQIMISNIHYVIISLVLYLI